ncbi:MAG: hypothetical protein HOM21_03470, partial [Halobacteriovoraceae bacterium]|nr:hypothetical protein [Halobacteriovoraceae bacterium]
MKKSTVLILLCLLTISCSNDETYSTWDMWNMAQDADSSIELVKITDPSQRILCENYGEGCIKGSGKRILVRRVELITVQFESMEQARAEAKRLNQWYVRNWLLDDVTKEPVLENF